jgi:hypothetical protein
MELALTISSLLFVAVVMIDTLQHRLARRPHK